MFYYCNIDLLILQIFYLFLAYFLNLYFIILCAIIDEIDYRGGYLIMNENEYNSFYGDSSSSDFSQNAFAYKVAISESVIAQSFLFMFIALAITAVSALYTLNSSLIYYLYYYDLLFYGLIIGEFVVVIAANHAMSHQRLVPSAILFTAYAVINGITLSSILIFYAGSSIVSVFVITSALFGVMAFIGFVTKKDLSSLGGICAMGLIGLIIASIVNMFLGSTGLDMIISYIGVIIFVGLTAYDVQKIKNITMLADSTNATILGLYGALQLYLDFVNLFIKLLRIMGKRK